MTTSQPTQERAKRHAITRAEGRNRGEVRRATPTARMAFIGELKQKERTVKSFDGNTAPLVFPSKEKTMNTVAHHYRAALELYNRDSSSQQVDIAIAECASAFAASQQPVALVGIYTPEQITESHKNFWKALEDFGLCVKFWPCRDSYAYMGVQLIKPKPQLETAAARVVEVPTLAVAA